jgi:hypothetical protein
MKVTDILQDVGAKVGIPCALLLGYLYMQTVELNDKVSKLESKTEAITEIKSDLASIKTSVDLILKYNLKERTDERK